MVEIKIKQKNNSLGEVINIITGETCAKVIKKAIDIGYDLSNTDLSHLDLTTLFDGSNNFIKYFTNTNFSNSIFNNPDLSNRSFKNCNFTNINLTIAILDNVEFIDCDLTGVEWNTDYPAPKGWELDNSKYIKKIPDLIHIKDNLSKIIVSGSTIYDALTTAANIDINLANADLSNIDVSILFKNKSEHHLVCTNLTHSFFNDVDLSNSYLRLANLKYATFNNCVLKHVNLRDANLVDTLFNNCDLEGVIWNTNYPYPEGWQSLNGKLVKINSVKITNITGDKILASGETVSKCLVDVAKNNQLLDEANLSGVVCNSINLSKLTLTNTDLQKSQFCIVNFTGSCLLKNNFDHSKIDNSNFTRSNLSSSDLSNVEATHAIFIGAFLTNTNFTNANLVGADFTSASLSSTNFTNANLSFANFKNTNVNGANFDGACLDNVIWNDKFPPPKGWKLVNGKCAKSLTPGIITPNDIVLAIKNNKPLENINLNSIILDNFDFNTIILRDSDLKNSSCRSTNFNKSNLTYINFNGAHIASASFIESSLIGSDLTNVYAVGANFNKANLELVNFKNANLTMCDFTNASFLQNDFTGANLLGANFTNVNLTDINFTNANLTDVTWNVKFPVPNGWELINGKLYSNKEKAIDLTESVGEKIIRLMRRDLDGYIGSAKEKTINVIVDDIKVGEVSFNTSDYKKIEKITSVPIDKNHLTTTQIRKSIKKENNMSNNTEVKKADNNFYGLVKVDAGNAAYRIVANQASKGVRGGLVKLAKSQGFKNKQIIAISELLDSEPGRAIVQTGLGYALTYAPRVSADPRVKHLASELRIEGMALAGNLAVEELLGFVLPAVMDIFTKLPPVEELSKTRIAELANEVMSDHGINTSDDKAEHEDKAVQEEITSNKVVKKVNSEV